jgi:hypothetical protein
MIVIKCTPFISQGKATVGTVLGLQLVVQWPEERKAANAEKLRKKAETRVTRPYYGHPETGNRFVFRIFPDTVEE